MPDNPLRGQAARVFDQEYMTVPMPMTAAAEEAYNEATDHMVQQIRRDEDARVLRELQQHTHQHAHTLTQQNTLFGIPLTEQIIQQVLRRDMQGFVGQPLTAQTLANINATATATLTQHGNRQQLRTEVNEQGDVVLVGNGDRQVIDRLDQAQVARVRPMPQWEQIFGNYPTYGPAAPVDQAVDDIVPRTNPQQPVERAEVTVQPPTPAEHINIRTLIADNQPMTAAIGAARLDDQPILVENRDPGQWVRLTRHQDGTVNHTPYPEHTGPVDQTWPAGTGHTTQQEPQGTIQDVRVTTGRANPAATPTAPVTTFGTQWVIDTTTGNVTTTETQRNPQYGVYAAGADTAPAHCRNCIQLTDTLDFIEPVLNRLVRDGHIEGVNMIAAVEACISRIIRHRLG